MENGNTYEYKSDYDLLIIVNKNSQANADTFVTTLTGRLAELKLDTPVHPIIHGIEFVNEALREGNYFFDDIKKEGVLLFNTSRYTLDKKRDMSSTELAQEQKRITINGSKAQMSFITILNTTLKKVTIKSL